MAKALGGHIRVPGEAPIIVSRNLENGQREADFRGRIWLTVAARNESVD
jgi:hypothetical protein